VDVRVSTVTLYILTPAVRSHFIHQRRAVNRSTVCSLIAPGRDVIAPGFEQEAVDSEQVARILHRYVNFVCVFPSCQNLESMRGVYQNEYTNESCISQWPSEPTSAPHFPSSFYSSF
jgi:hypothetical protein